MTQKHRWNNFFEFIDALTDDAKVPLTPELEHFQVKRYILSLIASKFQYVAVDYLEFGVFKGSTFRYVQNLFHRDSCFYGFDSFLGLPEMWTTHMPLHRKYNQRGYRPNPEQSFDNFNLNGLAPEPGNGVFIKGIFQETLEKFLESFTHTKPIVVLVDCDLYSSTLYLLCRLHGVLQNGDVIVFDEFGDEANEFKAFNDYVHSHYVKDKFKCIYCDTLDGLVVAFEKVE